MSGRVLIVDLSSVFFPAWHASADKPIGFAYEATIARVRDEARAFEHAWHPAHVIIACDSGRSFRKEIAPTYKANRDEKDRTLIEQIKRVQETLEADGFHVAKSEGFEADDLIATFTAQASGQGFDVLILSGDKDLCALAAERVRIKSVSSKLTLGPDDVLAKFGVKPAQMRDFLALVGDASDGVRGVPGIGPKNASKLLGQFGSLSGIIDAIDAKDAEDNPVVKPPSICSALRAAIKDGSLDLACRLITMRTDVPVDFAAALVRRDVKPLRPDFGADLKESEEPMREELRSKFTVPVINMRDEVIAYARTPVEHPASIAEAEPETAAPAPVMPRGSAELVPADTRWTLEPRSMKDAVWLAGRMFESRLFNGYGNPDAVLAVVLAGRELGLGAMTALRAIHVIKGKVAMSSQLMVGLCLSSGKAEHFDLAESTPERATYVTKRKGASREVSLSFTIGEAQQMGLLGGSSPQWDKAPANMLRHRCAAQLCRVVYPDVCSNTYLPEELDS